MKSMIESNRSSHSLTVRGVLSVGEVGSAGKKTRVAPLLVAEVGPDFPASWNKFKPEELQSIRSRRLCLYHHRMWEQQNIYLARNESGSLLLQVPEHCGRNSKR